MVAESAIDQINQTFEKVRIASYEEKRDAVNSEEIANRLLDAVLELKSLVQNKTLMIQAINEQLEALTWLDNLDENNLLKINEIISLSKDLRSSLIRYLIGLNQLIDKGIAKAEIKEFRGAISDLKEIIQDLESHFFYLPQMPDFVETTRELSLL